MNLVNDEALQEIKQQLSEIKISTSKKNENFAFSSFACANPSDNQKSKSVKYDELTNNNKSSKNIFNNEKQKTSLISLFSSATNILRKKNLKLKNENISRINNVFTTGKFQLQIIINKLSSNHHLEHNNSLNELIQYPIVENSFLSSPTVISTSTTATKSNSSKTTSPILTSASNQISNDLMQFPLNDSSSDHQFPRFPTSAQEQIMSNLASINNSFIQRSSNNQQQK